MNDVTTRRGGEAVFFYFESMIGKARKDKGLEKRKEKS